MAYDRMIPGAVSPERAERLSAWAQRKPRVALMGEFSAGKSTLLNFLIEENLIPTRATATEVPPVWFSHGEPDAYWVDAEGERHEIHASDLGTVPMSARYVRVFSKAEILEHCDIVDTPGISDPNLADESWRFAAGIANMVLWCTSATQAWRETERSAWLSLPERLRQHSLLIVTRADKLVAEIDRDKVQRRLARETAGLFCDRVFMATPDAVKAKAELAEGESSPLWEASGAAALLDRLVERFEAIYRERGALLRQRLTGTAEPVEPAPVAEAAEAEPELGVEAEAESTGPRPTRPVRVQPGAPRRTERLRPADAEALLADLRDDAPPPAAAAALEESFFGADDDKDDRALRDALGLDEPVRAPQAPGKPEAGESAPAMADGPEAPEAEAPAETEEAAWAAGDSEAEAEEAMWAALEAEAESEAEPEADEAVRVVAEALAETGAEADETGPDMPEAAVDVSEADPGLARRAEEAAGEAEMPVDAAAEAVEPGEDLAMPERAEAAMPGAEPVEAEDRAAAVDVAVAEDEAEAEELAEDDLAAETSSEALEPVEMLVAGEPAVEAESVGTADEASVEDEAEAEVPARVDLAGETLAEGVQPVVTAAAAKTPYLLDAEHSVQPGRPQAAAPPSVRVWREIVARTALLPGNAQIAAMIEELLMALETAEPAPEAEVFDEESLAEAREPAAAAADGDEQDAAPEGASADAGEADEAGVRPGSLSGWRRLA